MFLGSKKIPPLSILKALESGKKKILKDIANHIARNETVDFPEMYRLAVASGRGIGKSALVSWLILWFLSTRLGSTIIVTANTEQ